MKALKLKALNTSIFNSITLYRQLKKEKIFSAFNFSKSLHEDLSEATNVKKFYFYSLKFFKDFKYFQVYVYWVKKLIKMFFKKTLYTAMTRSFFEINQKRSKCIIQKAKLIFIFRFSIIQNRVILHYRQVFLYIIRYFRKLSSDFTKLKLKFNERKIRTTENLNKFILYKLSDLTKRLKFKSKKISDLKTKNFNHADE